MHLNGIFQCSALDLSTFDNTLDTTLDNQRSLSRLLSNIIKISKLPKSAKLIAFN